MTDTSTYLKISRAVDGDDWYMQRLKMCAEIEDYEFSRKLAILTTNAVAAHITVDEDMAVNTSGVTDNQIRNSMKTQYQKLHPEVDD